VPTVIRTARLQLRALVASDADGVIAAMNDWAVAQWVSSPPFPYRQTDFDTFLNIVRDDHATGRPSRFGMADRESNMLIGTIGIEPKSADLGELGYWIGQPFWGRGYASEAAAALVQHAWERLPFRRLSAVTDPENGASHRVLLKTGFVCTGTQPREKPSRRGSTALRTYEYAGLSGAGR
jgi:RimJ/RimL family protein N-acetyltransferase